MSRDQLLRHISISPNVCFGKPVVGGTRIWVSLVVNYLASGHTMESIVTEYPQLTAEDVRACLVYAAALTRGSDFELPLESGCYSTGQSSTG